MIKKGDKVQYVGDALKLKENEVFTVKSVQEFFGMIKVIFKEDIHNRAWIYNSLNFKRVVV